MNPCIIYFLKYQLPVSIGVPRGARVVGDAEHALGRGLEEG